MKKTNLWWISCSRFLSGYSENIIYFLLPIVAYKAVGRIQDTGLIIFIHLSCRLLGYPFSGVLCDKIGEKKVFILVSFVRGAACLLVFWLLGPFHQEQSSLPILMFNLLGIVDGFAGGVASIAFETMGPRLYPNERFRDFQASVQTADQIALIAAPATGVVLLNSLGTSYSLAILGIIFMFAGIMFLPYLKIVSSDGDITPSSLRDSGFIIQEVLASLSIIFNNRLIAVTLILTILDNLLLGIYSAITTPLALVTFHGSEQSLGLALTLGYLASMIAIYYSHWIHQKKSNLWLWKGSYIIAYLGFFLMALAPNFGSFALSVILIETSCAAGVFALRLFRAQAIPNADFGKVSGMLFLLQQVTLPFGGMMIACLHNPNQLQKLLLFSSLPVGLLTMALLRWDSLWQSL